VNSGIKVLRVFVPPVDQAVADAVTYVESGVVPPTAIEQSLEEYMAEGRATGCTCGQIQCVCQLLKGHTKECRYRISVACPVAVECEHGFDVCPTCDACNCGAV
jgi:hypothetical protein